MKKIVLFSLLQFVLVSAQFSGEQKHILDSLNKSKEIFQKKNDLKNLSQIYYALGKFYDEAGDISSSNKMILLTIETAKKINDKERLGKSLNYLASNYSYQGKSPEAVKTYYQAYSVFEQLKDSSKMAQVLINLGSEYVESGDFKKALETELKALKIKELAKDSSNIAYYYEQIAEIYFAMKNYPKWKEYVYAAYKLAENPDYTSFLTRIKILNELAEINRKENKIYEAEKIYNQIYDLSLKEEYLKGQSLALTNLVPVYIQQAKLKEAEKAAFKSLEIDRKLERISGVVYNLIQLGKLNRTLSRYTKAEEYALEGLALAKKLKYHDDILNGLNELYMINKSTGKTAAALKYFEEYSDLKDSLFSRDANKQIAEMQTKYETEKKENRIKLLNQQNEIQQSQLNYQKMAILIILVLAVLLFATGYFFYKQRRIKAELSALAAEHKMLRSQMNPHFIFNSLNAIQNFLLKNDSYKTADYLSDFASLMRLILTGSRSDFITLEQEEKIITYYLELQSIRFNNKFEYQVNFSGDINKEYQLIPPMLLQPFIENAVEHGLRKTEENGFIKIDFITDKNILKIVIEDNGSGINFADNEKRNEHISYSTQITNERIETLNRIYKTKITLLINDLSTTGGKGTKVEFNFPLNYNEGEK